MQGATERHARRKDAKTSQERKARHKNARARPERRQRCKNAEIGLERKRCFKDAKVSWNEEATNELKYRAIRRCSAEHQSTAQAEDAM